MNVFTDLFLDPEDKIVAERGQGQDYVRLRFGERSNVYVTVDSLPQRIAELEAAALALRDVVDDLIADEKANTPEPQNVEPPAYESVLVADLTAGRLIQRCGEDDRWRTVVGVAPHPHLPDVILVDLDGDQVATLNERDAVRALVVVGEAAAEQDEVGVDAGAVA